MCGICGKLSYTAEDVRREVLERMCATLFHRGPDADGFYLKPKVGLAQRRLAILDLSPEANPPLCNETEDIWVVFNGEIYNYQDLRADLTSKGHVFQTHGDTEVIVHLYEEYGYEAVERLRGMFAFGLWDSRLQRFFAARDRFGKKPFFYTRNHSGFTFASELSAIRCDPAVSINPNLSAIDEYLTSSYIPAGQTAYQGIYSLPAAHYMVCDLLGNVELRRYWSPPVAQPSNMSTEESEAAVLELLRESVRLRAVADVPVGAFLSGGIDSGLTVALLSEMTSRPVKTFTIGFGNSGDRDERQLARLVASRYGTDHHECELPPITISAFEDLVHRYGQPFADSSAYPTYAVSKAARESVTVALSGDGGDESFAGYQHYREPLQWLTGKAGVSPVVRIVGKIASTALKPAPAYGQLARAARGFSMLSAQLEDRYALQLRCVKPQEAEWLYTDSFKAELARSQNGRLRALRLVREDGEAAIDYMMRHDQNHYLPDCLMTKTDIASMANSLEVRCPFLDHKLVEFASTIPHSLKYKGGRGKLMLRNLAARFLPNEIVVKKKTGFSIPLGSWLAGPMSGLLSQLLSTEASSLHRLIRPEAIKMMISQHVTGKRPWQNRLWALMVLQMWLTQNQF